MRNTLRLATVLILLTAFPGIQAEDPTDDEEVYVYTNADVEKLAPIPSAGTVHIDHDPQAWALVAAFIRGERAKISSERDREHERELAEIEAERPIGYGERYPVYLRVPHYPARPLPRVLPDTEPETDEGSPTSIPHPMFRDRPPVREFVPGLGDSYRRNPPAKAQ